MQRHPFHKYSEKKYVEYQKINIAKINCDICGKTNTTLNNEMNICNTCNIILYPEHKNAHNKNNKIIDYDSKYFICQKNNETYNLFYYFIKIKNFNFNKLFIKK